MGAASDLATISILVGAPMMFYRYPRTRHIEGSRHQPGDAGLVDVPFNELARRRVIVEEKVDGANVGVSFSEDGRLHLQSRGHFLGGGPSERQFDLFKAWTACFQERLMVALGSRYLLFGEWLYAKHTVFYDALPHYFLAFDVMDTTNGRFLAAERRRSLLDGLPILSTPVVWSGVLRTTAQLSALIRPSNFKSPNWRTHLLERCTEEGADPSRVVRETDPSENMEGLYVRVEDDGWVVTRAKFVRSDFLSVIEESGSHWADRPIIPNQLDSSVDIFAG